MQLKGTMPPVLVYYEQSLCLGGCAHEARSKRFQPEPLNWQVKDITETGGLLHIQPCAPHDGMGGTFVLLIVIHFFKGLEGTIGHFDSFMLLDTPALPFHTTNQRCFLLLFLPLWRIVLLVVVLLRQGRAERGMPMCERGCPLVGNTNKLAERNVGQRDN